MNGNSDLFVVSLLLPRYVLSVTDLVTPPGYLAVPFASAPNSLRDHSFERVDAADVEPFVVGRGATPSDLLCFN